MEFQIVEQFNSEILAHLEKLGLVGENKVWQLYTLNHKQAFIATELAIIGSNTTDGILHDVDKLVAYGLIDKTNASLLHRRYAGHHIQNCESTDDYKQCIIDYECARFTKKDKPLNAYDTIMKYCPYMYNQLLATLSQMKLNRELNYEIDFSAWRQLNSSEIQHLIDANVSAIDQVNQLMKKFGIEKGLEIFYSTEH